MLSSVVPPSSALNSKGGCGKSTTILILAGEYAAQRGSWRRKKGRSTGTVTLPKTAEAQKSVKKIEVKGE